MTQATLPFSGTIQDRFAEYHASHPEVYAHLRSLALDLRGRGWQRYGIKSLWERTRWHFQVDRGLGEDFKMNNNWHSRYARLLMDSEPGLAGFFELRELKSA